MLLVHEPLHGAKPNRDAVLDTEFLLKAASVFVTPTKEILKLLLMAIQKYPRLRVWIRAGILTTQPMPNRIATDVKSSRHLVNTEVEVKVIVANLRSGAFIFHHLGSLHIEVVLKRRKWACGSEQKNLKSKHKKQSLHPDFC